MFLTGDFSFGFTRLLVTGDPALDLIRTSDGEPNFYRTLTSFAYTFPDGDFAIGASFLYGLLKFVVGLFYFDSSGFFGITLFSLS